MYRERQIPHRGKNRVCYTEKDRFLTEGKTEFVILKNKDSLQIGLRIRSKESGSAFSIGELQGTLAESLGLRTLHGGTQISELNYGRGLTTTQGTDLIIIRNDGTPLNIDLDGASTVADVLDTINNHAGNQDAATRVTASLTSVGNGIELTSPLSALLGTTKSGCGANQGSFGWRQPCCIRIGFSATRSITGSRISVRDKLYAQRARSESARGQRGLQLAQKITRCDTIGRLERDGQGC